MTNRISKNCSPSRASSFHRRNFVLYLADIFYYVLTPRVHLLRPRIYQSFECSPISILGFVRWLNSKYKAATRACIRSSTCIYAMHTYLVLFEPPDVTLARFAFLSTGSYSVDSSQFFRLPVHIYTHVPLHKTERDIAMLYVCYYTCIRAGARKQIVRYYAYVRIFVIHILYSID